MDLNHILIFVALLSPVVVLVRSQRSAALNRRLRNAAFAVLLVTAVSWLLVPNQAGFIGGAMWFVLLLTPTLGSHQLADLTILERFSAAHRLAQFLSIIHPTRAFRDQATLLRALAIARRGDTPRALQMLQSLQSGATTVASQAIAQSFRLRGDWENFQAWCRSSFTPLALQRTGLAPLYLRGLGERHRPDDLILHIAGPQRDAFPFAPGRAEARPIESGAADNLVPQLSLVMLWAFTGRKALLVRLFETALRKFDPEGKVFWLATADLAAGKIEAGRQQLQRLHAQTSNAILQSEIVARLQHANAYAHALASRSPESDRILQRLETRPMRQMPYFARTGRNTPVVIALIALNVGMFLLEIIAGGSTNPFVLHRLGQLETFDFFITGEYWRLITSLFLHYGLVHLLFNIYALYILGPALERSIGASRFIACYLISGIGSGLGVVLLHMLGLTPAEEVVGASGCIMGIVGAWAGFLLRYRHLPLARRRLQNILFIVVIQTIFDLSTPQVSMAAHMCGLLTGLLLGLILAPRETAVS
jgi:rhomboid protease GluP